MTLTAYKTQAVGDPIIAADWNTYIRDNGNEGAVAKVTTAGDTVYATGANALARLAIGATGTIYKVSGGVPSWANDERATQVITGGPVTSSADDWSDMVTGTITTTWAATIMAVAAFTKQKTGVDSWGSTRLMIDGTGQTANDGADPASGGVVPMSLVGRKAGVAAGSVSVKLQHYDAVAGDNRATYDDVAIVVWAAQA